MSIQDSALPNNNFPDQFDVNQIIVLDQYSNTKKNKQSFFNNDFFLHFQSISAIYPTFFPSYLKNIFQSVSGTFFHTSNWPQQVAKLQDPSIINLDRFNALLQNFFPNSQSNIYYPEYSTTQLFINSCYNNYALVQNISLLPPQTFVGTQFYPGNPVDHFGFCFFPHCHYNSEYFIFDADLYVNQLQYIYNSPQIKKVQFYNSLRHKFQTTNILQKKNNIIYIQVYDSVLPFYVDSSISPNQTLLFPQSFDQNLLYDYSKWSTTIFKSSYQTSLHIFNHFYPSVDFIFSFTTHPFNHFDARWILKLFNIHYLYNHLYFSLQGSIDFQNINSDQFPSISFSSSKCIFDPVYKKSVYYIHYPQYFLFHLQFFSDLQFQTRNSSQFPQLNFRYFHDPIPSQCPIPIPFNTYSLSDDDNNDDLFFGSVSFDSAQSNYNIISDNNDEYLESNPIVQQAYFIDPIKYKYIFQFQRVLNFQFSVDQFIFIFNRNLDINSFNKKIQNASYSYSQFLQKIQQSKSSFYPLIKNLTRFTCTFLQVAISSFYIYLISNQLSFSQLLLKNSILLNNFSNNIIDSAQSNNEIIFIKKIGVNQLSNFIFSELQSFGDSYSYFATTIPIQPPSQLSQFQYFNPPLFSQLIISKPDNTFQFLHNSIFNNINRLLVSNLIPFYSDISSVFQLSSQFQSQISLPLFLHSFSNFKNSRIQKYSFPYHSPFFQFKSSQLISFQPISKSFPIPFNYDSILTSNSSDRDLHLFYTIQHMLNILSPHSHFFKHLFYNLQKSPTLGPERADSNLKEIHRLLVKFISFQFSSILQKFSIFRPSSPSSSSYINQIIENHIYIFSDDFVNYNKNFLSSYSFIQHFDYSQFQFFELVYILLKSFILYTRLIDFSIEDKPNISQLINMYNQYDKYPDNNYTSIIINQHLFENCLIVIDCLFWYLNQQFINNIIDYPSLISKNEEQREQNKNYKFFIKKKLNIYQKQQITDGFCTLDDFIAEIFYNPTEQDIDYDFDKDTQPITDNDPEELNDYYQNSDQESDYDNLDSYNQNYDE